MSQIYKVLTSQNPRQPEQLEFGFAIENTPAPQPRPRKKRSVPDQYAGELPAGESAPIPAIAVNSAVAPDVQPDALLHPEPARLEPDPGTEELRARLAAAEAEAAELKTQIEKNMAELDATRRALSEQVAAATADAQKTREREVALESELAAARERTETAERALAEVRKQVAALEEQLSRRNAGSDGQDASDGSARTQALIAALEREQQLRAEDSARATARERQLSEQWSAALADASKSLDQALARCADLEVQLKAAVRDREQADADAAATLAQANKELALLRDQVRLAESQSRRQEPELRRLETRLEEALEAVSHERRLRAEQVAQAAQRDRKLAEEVAAARHEERANASSLLNRMAGVFAVVLMLACAACFGLGRFLRPSETAKETAAAAPVLTEQPPIQPESDPVAAGHVAPKPEPEAVPVSPPPPPAWPQVSVAGLLTKASTDELAMVFEYGVFSRRSEISDRARQDLARLAEQLRGWMPPFALEVLGHTDNEPVGAGPYPDNKALGLERAVVVKDYLVRQCELPPDRITTVSAGADDAPYPNNSAESRRKNRTVTLRLRR